MKLRPLYDQVVVKSVEVETVTAGGLILPSVATEKATEGVVVALGSGEVQKDGSLKPLTIAVGDRVLFGKYHGYEVKVDGEKLLMMKYNDLMAVLR